MKSVYQDLIGGGQNISHMLAILDLSYSHFNISEIHEAWVNTKDNTIDFYVDDPQFGLTLDDVLVESADGFRVSPIPNLVVVQYAIPEASKKVLEGLVKMQEEDHPDGNMSPCDRYTKNVGELKTIDPYEQRQKLEAQKKKLQELGQQFAVLDDAQEHLPDLERKMPEHLKDVALPETALENLNKHLEEKSPTPTIIKP